MLESISSKVRFSLLPYSAARQPVQCRLQPYCSRRFSCTGQPMMWALRKKVALSASLSVWVRMSITGWRMLLSGASMTLRTASRWVWKLLGPAPASLSTQGISLGAFSSGFFSR